MKGVILAGGTGTRLAPLTAVVNKHLLPVYDQQMILYPLATLRSFGVSDILIVTGGEHLGMFAEFLGDGSAYGVHLTYRIQSKAGGIAQALACAEEFVGNSRTLVILGDNVFDSEDIITKYAPLADTSDMAQLWVKMIPDAHRFGVLREVTPNASPVIEEKPKIDGGGWAVTGMYSYPSDVFDVIRGLTPSARGELEITDVNNFYLSRNRCTVTRLSEENFWSDAGTFDSLLRAANWAHARRVGGTDS